MMKQLLFEFLNVQGVEKVAPIGNYDGNFIILTNYLENIFIEIRKSFRVAPAKSSIKVILLFL